MANRIVIFCVSIFYQFLFGVISFADTPGLVEKAPSNVRSVKTDRGYMIPYKVELSDKVSFEMIPIPGGKFKLGSPDSEKGRNPDEGPQVEVEIAPFWMGKCEVTWGEYHEYMNYFDAFSEPDGIRAIKVTEENKVDAVTCPSKLYMVDHFEAYGAGELFPAVTMSQFSARQYTKWLSKRTELIYRLPNEAEWEYACRAGSVTAYCYGDDPKQLSDYAWTKENAKEKHHQVGLKKPNSWGLHDMHGSVMEWTLDGYTKDGYLSLNENLKKVTVSKDAEMVGLALTSWPVNFYGRTLRGGCIFHPAEQARSAAKHFDHKLWHETEPRVPPSPMWYSDEPSMAAGFRILRQLNDPTKSELKKCWEVDNEKVREAVNESTRNGNGALGIPVPISKASPKNSDKTSKSLQKK